MDSKEGAEALLAAFTFVHHYRSSSSSRRGHREDKSRVLSYVQSKRRHRETKQRFPQAWEARISPTHVITSNLIPKNKKHGEDEQVAAATSTSSNPLPITRSVTPENNASDPFHCTVAGFDAGSHRLLHFAYFSSLVGTTFLAEAFAPSQVILTRTRIRHENIIQARLKQCIEDSALMYSTLAYGASYLGWVCGVLDKEALPEYFVDKALRAVRSRLADAEQGRANNWLLLSIYSLAITDFWANHPSLWTRCSGRHAVMLRARSMSTTPARLHLNALIHMVNSVGGWDYVDPYVLESTILLDKFVSGTDAIPPVLPLTWDPGRTPPITEYRPPIYYGHLGERFPQAVRCRDLLDILRDIATFATIALDYWACPQSYTTDMESWLFRRLQALVYRLMLLVELEHIDECTRLAAIVLISNTTEHNGPQTFAETSVQHLQKALIRARFEDDRGDMAPDLKLWCVLIGCMAAKSSSPEKNWFMAAAAQCISRMNVELTEVMLEWKMERFLYISSRQQAKLRDVLEELKWHAVIPVDGD
ncbi:hypothetical protein HD806DRAFT_484209 [Xylariaceae sp. AK1471]|nr:hypothetical protein HD806DRAFT_484209 [Xylariaceae sp. AK1471]